MEQWKDIEGYEGLYQVSDMGNVKSLVSNKNLKPYTTSFGYLQVNLSKDGKKKTFKVHRLVARAFIENPENKEEVDQIDTNRTNNRVTNLRWVTRKENQNNPLTKERIKTANKLTQPLAITKTGKKVMCITTGEVFNSAREAADHYNMKDRNGVSHAASPKHKQKSAGELPDGTPLEWKYI